MSNVANYFNELNESSNESDYLAQVAEDERQQPEEVTVKLELKTTDIDMKELLKGYTVQEINDILLSMNISHCMEKEEAKDLICKGEITEEQYRMRRTYGAFLSNLEAKMRGED